MLILVVSFTSFFTLPVIDYAGYLPYCLFAGVECLGLLWGTNVSSIAQFGGALK